MRLQCTGSHLRKTVTGVALGSSALLTLYYIYSTEYADTPSANEESLRTALGIVENEWGIAIDRMVEVNTLIDDAENASAIGENESAARTYWIAAAMAREIADIYRDSVSKLFELPYSENQTFGDILRFKTFILQACTLSCNTYDLAAQLYKAAGDLNSSNRVLDAKECIHRYIGLHENSSLNAQELKLALDLELRRSTIELSNIPHDLPRGLTLDAALVNKIEKFDIERRVAAHEAAVRVFDEL